ncbi:hypothetical protein Tco_1469155 [Tanacetum coccineum]
MPPVSALAKYKLVFLGDQSVGKTSIITHPVAFNPVTLSLLLRFDACLCSFYITPLFNTLGAPSANAV